MNYTPYLRVRPTPEWDAAPVEPYCMTCGSIDWLPAGEHDCEARHLRHGEKGLGSHNFDGLSTHFACVWCRRQWVVP